MLKCVNKFLRERFDKIDSKGNKTNIPLTQAQKTIKN